MAKKITIQRVKPGMKIIKPVHNLQGVALLQEGVVLNEKYISILRSWGIPEVYIEGGEETPDDRKAKRREAFKITKDIERKFAGVIKNKIMDEIMSIAKKQLAEEIEEG